MSLRLILIGLAALAIISAVGGTIYAAKSYVDGLNEQITQQQEQIAVLEIDKAKLEISNESLENEITRKSDEMKEAFAEITRLRKADAESETRLNGIETLLRDQERAKRLQTIRNSRRASLLLRLQNKQIKCWVENFDRFDGKCIRGKWVIDGERFVPLEENTQGS
ncbi:hypothetical protein LCGC14_0740140 [marine sediment metagenome]|uniref:Uncharacterized protein n=1 Tax=marine sediment metagenome TaxID=412755 RepID=A0A0F9QBB6_9ZZZZ